MTPTHFRILLALSLVLAMAGSAVDYLFPLLPEPLRIAQTESDESLSTGALVVMIAVGVGLTLAGIAAYVGLFRFSPWAPRLSVAVTAVAVLVLPFLGSTAQSGLATALADASSVLWGIVLALAYWSPLATRFARSDA